MGLRVGHGNGAGRPHIEVMPAGEALRGVPDQVRRKARRSVAAEAKKKYAIVLCRQWVGSSDAFSGSLTRAKNLSRQSRLHGIPRCGESATDWELRVSVYLMPLPCGVRS